MNTSSRSARARARANFALIKYWGKAQDVLNVPAVGSISITLEALWSDTEVEFGGGLSADDFVLDGRRRSADLGKVSACLDLLRAMAGTQERAVVRSTNNFPTGAGLASSASGFAALVTAAAAALELDLAPRELSIIARQGSGSAARSIFGGFVEMHAGVADDGRDSFAEPLLDAARWPLEVVIAITAKNEKEVDSRSGMTRSAQASPVLSGMGSDASRRSRHRARRHSAPRLRGASRGCRAQLLEDARRGDRRPTAAALLECGDAAVHDGDSEAAPRRRCPCSSRSTRVPKSKRSASRARERKWSGRWSSYRACCRFSRARSAPARSSSPDGDRRSSAGQARRARRVRRARGRASDRVGGRPVLRGDACAERR